MRYSFLWSGKRDSNSQPSAWKADALPIELFPPGHNTLPLQPATTTMTAKLSCFVRSRFPVRKQHKPSSRKTVVEGGGFEPPKASPTDLQSVPFGHSGTPPHYKQKTEIRSPQPKKPNLKLLVSAFRYLLGAGDGT